MASSRRHLNKSPDIEIRYSASCLEGCVLNREKKRDAHVFNQHFFEHDEILKDKSNVKKHPNYVSNIRGDAGSEKKSSQWSSRVASRERDDATTTAKTTTTTRMMMMMMVIYLYKSSRELLPLPPPSRLYLSLIIHPYLFALGVRRSSASTVCAVCLLRCTWRRRRRRPGARRFDLFRGSSVH
uniref:Uncharacterized protein n=1 Tax=Trichogramma kaykai TaxID=54128 RepID=A0ABD2X161_9HYME